MFLGKRKTVMAFVWYCFIILALSKQSSVGSEDTGGWKWGDEGMVPRRGVLHQSATAMSEETYNKLSEFQKIPLVSSDPDDDKYQLNIFAYEIPPRPPRGPVTTDIEEGGEKGQRFHPDSDSERLSFANIVNDPANRGKTTPIGEEGAGTDIKKIDIDDPLYRGHGILFSIFREKTPQDALGGKARAFMASGTAYIVSPNCLITAAHNVVLDGWQRYRNPDSSIYAESIDFWPLMNGLKTKDDFDDDMFDDDGRLIDRGTKITGVKVHLQLVCQGSKCDDFDIAVLKLDKPLGKLFGFPTVRQVLPGSILTKKVFLAGYPAEVDGTTSLILKSCEGEIAEDLTELHQIYYRVDPATKMGQSGASLNVKGRNSSCRGAYTLS